MDVIIDEEPQEVQDDVEGKIFIGGLSWQTTETTLRSHFEKFGELDDVALMVDKRTGQPRGFGFIKMKYPTAADLVVSQEHIIDGRKVDVKKAVPRDKAPAPTRTESKKVFVGGLSGDVTDIIFMEYFAQFGSVKDAVVMVDRTTNRSRGFGFVTFDLDEDVDKVLSTENNIMGKWVEVKRAEPRDLKTNHDGNSRGQRPGMHNGMGGQQRGGHGMMHGRVGGGFNANVRDADYGGGYNAFGAGALPQRNNQYGNRGGVSGSHYGGANAGGAAAYPAGYGPSTHSQGYGMNVNGLSAASMGQMPYGGSQYTGNPYLGNMSGAGGNPYSMPGMNLQMQMGAMNPNLSGYGPRSMNADGIDPAVSQMSIAGQPQAGGGYGLGAGPNQGYDSYGRVNTQQVQPSHIQHMKLNGYGNNGYGSLIAATGPRDSPDGYDPNAMMQGTGGIYGTRQQHQGAIQPRPDRGYSKPY